MVGSYRRHGASSGNTDPDCPVTQKLIQASRWQNFWNHYSVAFFLDFPELHQPVRSTMGLIVKPGTSLIIAATNSTRNILNPFKLQVGTLVQQGRKNGEYARRLLTKRKGCWETKGISTCDMKQKGFKNSTVAILFPSSCFCRGGECPLHSGSEGFRVITVTPNLYERL